MVEIINYYLQFAKEDSALSLLSTFTPSLPTSNLTSSAPASLLTEYHSHPIYYSSV